MFKSALVVAALTLLSRILGFGRDFVLAFLFGASPLADALSLALRLPYLARRMYGEGSFSLSLTTCYALNLNHQASLLIRNINLIISLWLIPILALLFILAKPINYLLAPGLESLSQASIFFRLCLPYILLIVLTSSHMAILHGCKQFSLASFSTSIFNLMIIFTALTAMYLCHDPLYQAYLICFATTIGGLIQYLLLAAHTKKIAQPTDMAEKKQTALLAKNYVKKLPLDILTAAIPQLCFLIATALSSTKGQGQIAALFYAERLIEFPLGLLGAGLSILSAAKLSCLSQTPNQELQSTVRRVLLLALALNLPAALGLLALAQPLTKFLFGHGAFGEEAISLTSQAVSAYALGLPAYALSRPLLTLCHGFKIRKALFWACLSGLGTSLVCGLLLMPLDNGPAWGATLGLWAYALSLGLQIHSKIYAKITLLYSDVIIIFKIIFCSLCTFCMAKYIFMSSSQTLCSLFLAIGTGIGFFVITAKLTKLTILLKK